MNNEMMREATVDVKEKVMVMCPAAVMDWFWTTRR